jgi:hypothetical protein
MPPPLHWTPGDRRSIGAGVVVDVRRISVRTGCSLGLARLSAVGVEVGVVVAGARLSAVGVEVGVVVAGAGLGAVGVEVGVVVAGVVGWGPSGLRDEETAKSLLAVLHRHLGWADGRAPLRHGIPDPVVIIG